MRHAWARVVGVPLSPGGGLPWGKLGEEGLALVGSGPGLGAVGTDFTAVENLADPGNLGERVAAVGLEID